MAIWFHVDQGTVCVCLEVEGLADVSLDWAVRGEAGLVVDVDVGLQPGCLDVSLPYGFAEPDEGCVSVDVVDDVQLVAEPVDVLWLEAGRGLGQQGWFSLVKLREVSRVRKEYPR